MSRIRVFQTGPAGKTGEATAIAIRPWLVVVLLDLQVQEIEFVDLSRNLCGSSAAFHLAPQESSCNIVSSRNDIPLHLLFSVKRERPNRSLFGAKWVKAVVNGEIARWALSRRLRVDLLAGF
jgi:hypothetical protein